MAGMDQCQVNLKTLARDLYGRLTGQPTPGRHLARCDGTYLGYLSTRVVLKCFDRTNVTTTMPCGRLALARTIIDNAVPRK